MKTTEEIDRVLDLLHELQGLSPGGGIPPKVNDELLVLIRLAGAGGCGRRGVEYERMRHAVETNPTTRQRLLDALAAATPHSRSWAGSFVEQLFPREEAIPILTTALQTETDPEAASWLSMNLARSLQGAPDRAACVAIARAYERAKTSPTACLQTARAWGYAGCSEALPALASHLLTGGFDQKMVALDGMGALGTVDHPTAIDALWTTFQTAPWLELRRKCASLLVRATGTQRRETIERMLEVLSDSSASRDQREAAAEAISTADLRSEITEKHFPVLVRALVLNDTLIGANVLRILKRSYPDWASRLSKLVVASPDEQHSASLIRALASEDEARASAVRMLQGFASDANPSVRERATAALKDIGGEEAFQTLQELLRNRYIQPSDRLQEVSHEVFNDTVQRMRRNYETSLTMNRVIFWLGFGVIIVGVLSVVINPSENKFFGAAGVIAGLGTLVSLFFFGPLTRVQQALTELVQIEIAFMAFMHRLLQARSIFEQLYLARSIDLDTLGRFDELLQKGMSGTVELLEENIGKTRSNRPTAEPDGPNEGTRPTAAKGAAAGNA